MPAEFLTSKNNLKANYRFLSGWPKPGFRDSCHPEVVAACHGTRPPSFLLKDRPCVCTSLGRIPLISCGVATGRSLCARVEVSIHTSRKRPLTLSMC